MSCQLCESAPVDCYDCHQKNAVERENRVLHESVKEWSDDYNQLSKEFQLYREAKEAVIIGLQDMVERLLEANARLAKDLSNKSTGLTSEPPV